MAENKGISIGGFVLGIIAATALGAIVTYYVINKRQQTMSLNIPSSTIQAPVTHPAPSYTNTIASMSPKIMSESIEGGRMKYNNKERWKIIRNDIGDIESIEVIRDANIDNV